MFVYLFTAIRADQCIKLVRYSVDYSNCGGFLLIERMAIHLQDPFENRPTDTPVTAIAKTIEKNIKQMLNEYQSEFDILNEFDLKEEPQKVEKNAYFIL